MAKTDKKYNKKRTTICFKNEDDAKMYMLANKGCKFDLYGDGSVWIVNKVQKQRLKNGFLPISEMVLGSARLKLYEMYEEMLLNDIQVLGFKTDAIFFNRPKNPLSTYSFVSNCKEALGCWRLLNPDLLKPDLLKPNP